MAEKNPIVTIVMNDGDVMKLELYPEVAENTVETEPAVPVTASPENSL